ncbi:MAG TPA: hypothetical protein EYP62_05140 [Kiritimatiellae bacterium]|nr:hypothetical protein [Kiritimatiellia bacterium]
MQEVDLLLQQLEGGIVLLLVTRFQQKPDGRFTAQDAFGNLLACWRIHQRSDNPFVQRTRPDGDGNSSLPRIADHHPRQLLGLVFLLFPQLAQFLRHFAVEIAGHSEHVCTNLTGPAVFAEQVDDLLLLSRQFSAVKDHDLIIVGRPSFQGVPEDWDRASRGASGQPQQQRGDHDDRQPSFDRRRWMWHFAFLCEVSVEAFGSSR